MKHRGILIFILLSVLVFAGLMVYGDAPELVRSISEFSVSFWLIALILALVNFALRLVRWNYYLQVLDVKVDAKTSAIVFLAGLGMVVSPGRVGELAKSYFLKQRCGAPVSSTAPIVVTERISDMLSILLIGLWGLILIPYGWAVILLVLGGLGVMMFFLSTPTGIDILARLPIIRRWGGFLNSSGDAFRKLFSPRVMIYALILGGAAWLAEGIAFWVVLKGLESDVPLPSAVSIYCTATLLGAVTMLPGGLISTEGTMLALLQKIGLGHTVASTSTFIIRVCTLWFAVLIGLLALLYLQKQQPLEEGDYEASLAATGDGD